MAQKTPGPRPSDRFIPYYFIVFFILLALLLFWFVGIAVRTHTGVITENAYNKGLAYNKTIQKAETGEKLGWSGDIEMTGKTLLFRFYDQDKKPITNAQVKVFFVRPTTSGHDKAAELQPDGKGSYSAKPALELQGLWDITISALYNGHNYQQHKRLIVND